MKWQRPLLSLKVPGKGQQQPLIKHLPSGGALVGCRPRAESSRKGLPSQHRSLEEKVTSEQRSYGGVLTAGAPRGHT